MSKRNPFSGPTSGEVDERAPAPPAGDKGRSTSGGTDDRHAMGGGARIKAQVDPDNDLTCCRLPLTDLGNAERWRVRFGGDFRFCAELGWFWWDDRRWRLLSEEKDALPPQVMLSVFRTVRAIRNEAALVAASGWPNEHLTDKQERELLAWAEAHGTTSRELYLKGLRESRPDWSDEACTTWIEDREPMDVVLGKGSLWSQKIAAWAKTSEGLGKIGAIAKLAKSFPDIAVAPEALDTDQMAINVLNGTLRLIKGPEKRGAAEIEAGKSEWHSVWRIKRYPHRREDMITKLAPVKYAPAAACPHYDQFIAKVQPDAAMRRFLHQWGGYSLTGDVTEDKLAFFYGAGRNGKGTWVEVLAHLAGDYAGSIGIESLLDNGGQRRGDQATPDLADLPGVRLLRVSEPQKGMKFNDGLIKQLTGRDPVKARHLNKGFFEFFPDFKMTISGNTRPIVKDVSYGMWARLQLVPWDTTIPESEIDRELPAKVKAEASGILNRMIEGLLDWRENRLIIPEQVRVATQAYRDASDELGRFLSDLCEISADTDHIRVPAGDLHKLYKAWCDVAGGTSWSIKGFKSAMEDKGFKSITSNGVKWLGIRVRAGVTIEDVGRGVWPGKPDAIAPLSPANSDNFDDADPLGDWDG